jgi:hypothetical protein
MIANHIKRTKEQLDKVKRQRQTQRRKNRESGHQVFPRHALIGASGQDITHQRPAQTMTLAPGSILI